MIHLIEDSILHPVESIVVPAGEFHILKEIFKRRSRLLVKSFSDPNVELQAAKHSKRLHENLT